MEALAGAIYVFFWIVFDTCLVVATRVAKETAGWDVMTYGLFDFTVVPGGMVILGWR